MSAKEAQTMRRLIDSIKNADRGKTSGYDTTATVRRIEDGTAWVHIPGGVDETPVKLTIAAAPGDSVQVRVSGGRAFLVGNATAPPTDDTTARAAVKQIGAVNKVVKTVQRIAERAAKIAGNTNQYFWHTETGTDTGVHITEVPQDEFLRDPENGGGNLLLRSIGVAIRDGLTELAQFSIAGLKLFSESGVEFTNIGYGLVKTTSDDEEIEGPYYTFGTRDGGDIGYLSAVIGGGRATVYRAVAMCGGSATGLSSMACGSGATANSADQVVFGKQNVPDTSDKYAFIIGNGTPSAPSNALVVDWDGNLDCANHKVGVTECGTENGWTWYKYSDGSFDMYRRTVASLTSYYTSNGLSGYRADYTFPAGCTPVDATYAIYHGWIIGSGFAMAAGTSNKTTSGFRAFGLALAATGTQSCVIDLHVHGTYQ